MFRLAIGITNSSIKDITEGLFQVEKDLAIEKNIKRRLLARLKPMLPTFLFIERDACACACA
jgi:hypothetical protein